MPVPIPPGTDLVASLERFSRHGDDLMDRWDGSCFRRPVRLGAAAGAVWLRAAPGRPHRLTARVVGDLPAGGLRRRLARMLLDPRSGLLELAERDRVIARLLRLHPGVVPVLALDPLGALLGFVTAQQVNLAFATSVRRQLLLQMGREARLDDDFVMVPDPERLAAAQPTELAGLRLTRAKGRCLVAVGRAICDGSLDFEGLAQLDDESVLERLVRLPGLGRWTARHFLGRVLGRAVLVAEDLGVRKAVQVAYGLDHLPLAAEVERITLHYREAALAAQQLLLYHLAAVPSGLRAATEAP
ncbi:MAG: DNA-3-methyladenine glycosylase family protein [Candidatus Dormibacteria bacterium]